MRGSWVGALCSWCHCPLESGGTLPLQGGATQPPRLTPRIAEVATAHPLLLDNSQETSTGKRKKERREGGAHDRKASPTPLPRELERDARGLEKQSGQGWVTRRSGLLALWHSGSDTGSCLLFTDTEPFVELFRVARRNLWCSIPSTTGKAQFITTRYESCHN